jgi:hypothetical protein
MPNVPTVSKPTDLDSGQRQQILQVAECLLGASVDTTVTFLELSQAAGIDVMQNRYIVMAARKLLSEEYGIQFAPERGMGLRRLGSAAGVRHAGETGLRRARNAAKNGHRNLSNSLRVANDLSDEETRRANQQLATFGLIEHLAQPRMVRQMPADAPPKPDTAARLKEILGIE